MSKIKRYLFDQIKRDLAHKMVFIAGPRQVGKTTLAQSFLPHSNRGYLNWDIAAHREAILKNELPDTSIWLFDEIHKYHHWRNYLKGVYDAYHEKKRILVTGSARLNHYRRGGDSLQGRYHYLHLNPLSVKELNIKTEKEFEQLFKLGGFPEPFFTGSEVEAKRWSREYRSRLLEEDLTSLETVKDVGTLELMMLRLPSLVGSPLSINALREDLQISHKTADRWLTIFCNLYAIFTIPPFGGSMLRAVKKAQKHYHYDWTLVKDNGPRFENLIAVHLLKWLQYEIDTQARELTLHYFRDVDGREIDFIVTEENQPIYAIECKWNNRSISKNLHYFKRRYPECEVVQVSMVGEQMVTDDLGVRAMPALQLLHNFL